VRVTACLSSEMIVIYWLSANQTLYHCRCTGGRKLLRPKLRKNRCNAVNHRTQNLLQSNEKAEGIPKRLPTPGSGRRNLRFETRSSFLFPSRDSAEYQIFVQSLDVPVPTGGHVRDRHFETVRLPMDPSRNEGVFIFIYLFFSHYSCSWLSANLLSTQIKPYF